LSFRPRTFQTTRALQSRLDLDSFRNLIFNAYEDLFTIRGQDALFCQYAENPESLQENLCNCLEDLSDSVCSSKDSEKIIGVSSICAGNQLTIRVVCNVLNSRVRMKE
jgi:hypothetical protein